MQSNLQIDNTFIILLSQLFGKSVAQVKSNCTQTPTHKNWVLIIVSIGTMKNVKIGADRISTKIQLKV